MKRDAERSEIQVLGAATSFWEYGAGHGEPLVLVHGFRGDHHGLEGIARQLSRSAPELRVIVPDLPGFGESAAVPARTHTLDLYGGWLGEFVRSLGLIDGRFAILGHSFGSLVVANSLFQGLQPSNTTLINPISSPALEGPQALLTKLAIAYYRAADLLPEQPARALLGNPGIVRVMSEVMAKTGEKQLRSWIHDQHHRYFSRFSDTATLLQAFTASVSHTVAEYSAAFTTQTLLIVGDRDDITPLDEQLALKHRIADASLRIVPGVGHLVHYEAVEYAASEIVEFLRASSRVAVRAGEGAKQS